MEFLSLEWFSAMLSILMIDLVLAGDNAIVIGLAARNVAKEQQKLVIGLGTIGAIIIRILATLAVVWLLAIPGLLLFGGLLLLWIAYKLMTNKKKHRITAKTSILSAIGTIVIADAAMGLDNVLAVAGAAHGNFTLVIIGLVISIPIVVCGSTIILRLSQRFPWIITIGGGVLAYTAASMITSEPYLNFLFDQFWAKWSFIGLIVIGLLLFSKLMKSFQEMLKKQPH